VKPLTVGILLTAVMPFALYRWTGSIWPGIAAFSVLYAVLTLIDSAFNDLAEKLKLQAHGVINSINPNLANIERRLAEISAKIDSLSAVPDKE
jgi:hypothetical protein